MDDSKSIESALRRGDYYLVVNRVSTAEIWKDDLRLVGHKNNDTQEEFIISNWSACSHCQLPFRTHSEPDSSGRRTNNGLSLQQRHVSTCIKRPSNKQASSASRQTSLLSGFLTVKKGLTAIQQEKLKIAETRYVVDGMHSFLSLEQDGLQQLAQTCITIDSESGNLSVNEIWYGRKTIRETTLTQYNLFIASLISKLISKSIDCREFAACTDLWTDNHKQRSYLDFTGFWVNESWALEHTMLRCKVFEEAHKTGENIRKEIASIMAQFNMVAGDTPITTDASANIVAALLSEARYQCMAHRLSTVLGDVWLKTLRDDMCLAALDKDVRDVSGYVHRSDILSNNLPLSLKSANATRLWRSFYNWHNSFSVSYEAIRDQLEQRGMAYRLLQISPSLLNHVVQFFKPFNSIFDFLEMAITPTIQNVIPSYYLIITFLSEISNDCPNSIQLLKRYILAGLDDEYWTSTTTIHLIATVMDLTFRQ